MDFHQSCQRLSAISTMWTVLRQAHAGPADAAAAARELLLHRYGGAVRRYLLALLRDSHAADDLTQEFAVRLIRGGFHAADPERGRFRNYVKTALFHLVSAHQRSRLRAPEPLAPDSGPLAGLADAEAAEQERAFRESWRTELLGRTWGALAEVHPNHFAVLRVRAEHPELSSGELAQLLNPPQTAAGVRQALKRARELFAELLLEQVAHSLERPTPTEIEAELAELSLLTYIRPADG